MPISSFSADLDRLCELRQQQVDDVVRGVVTELGTRVVERTPVDTGLARGNWQVGNGGIDFDKSSPVDKQPLGSPPSGATVARWTQSMEGAIGGGSVYLTNNLPYARKLEYGSSKQNPAGMVRVTVAEAANVLAAVVTRVNEVTP